MSHYSKLPQEQKEKVDAFLDELGSKAEAMMKPQLLRDRSSQAFKKFMNDISARFEVKQEKLPDSGEPGHFILRIHKKQTNPCNEISISPWGQGWMDRPTLREEETRAILSIADQLDAAQLRIEELEEDLRLWKEEAYRWRHVQTGE